MQEPSPLLNGISLIWRARFFLLIGFATGLVWGTCHVFFNLDETTLFATDFAVKIDSSKTTDMQKLVVKFQSKIETKEFLEKVKSQNLDVKDYLPIYQVGVNKPFNSQVIGEFPNGEILITTYLDSRISRDEISSKFISAFNSITHERFQYHDKIITDKGVFANLYKSIDVFNKTEYEINQAFQDKRISDKDKATYKISTPEVDGFMMPRQDINATTTIVDSKLSRILRAISKLENIGIWSSEKTQSSINSVLLAREDYNLRLHDYYKFRTDYAEHIDYHTILPLQAKTSYRSNKPVTYTNSWRMIILGGTFFGCLFSLMTFAIYTFFKEKKSEILHIIRTQ